MGKGTRLRKHRDASLSLLFCDVDFDRASRPFGRGVPEAPPEGWAIARAGLVYARWDGEQCRIVGDELIQGRHPASRFIAALQASRGLIVGHGLISDLRAASAVTTIPDLLLRRSVDTLRLAQRLRGGTYATGCGLTNLAWENLRVRRRKPHIPDRLADSADPVLSVGRGDHDPREDAKLVAKLWAHLVTADVMRWGRGGPTTNGRPGQAAILTDHVLELTGKRPQDEVEQSRPSLRAEGHYIQSPEGRQRVQRYTLPAADLPPPSPIRELAQQLQAADLIPAGQLTDEELLTACQWLGRQENLNVRRRIATDKPLTKRLRESLADALWESTHPEFMQRLFANRKAARSSALCYIEAQRLQRELYRVRSLIRQALGHT